MGLTHDTRFPKSEEGAPCPPSPNRSLLRKGSQSQASRGQFPKGTFFNPDTLIPISELRFSLASLREKVPTRFGK